MIKWIETTGRSEEDAIAAALIQLGLDRDDVSIEVIERAKSGFLGFGGNPAKVRVSYEVEEEGGEPKPMQDLLREEVLSVVKEEPKAQPAPKAAPKEEKKEEPAPVETAKEETPAAPVEEETILAAKPGGQPPKAKQPKPVSYTHLGNVATVKPDQPEEHRLHTGRSSRGTVSPSFRISC